MIDLKKSYGNKYRISMDEAWSVETVESNSEKVKDKPWYYEIEGKYGTLSLQGAGDVLKGSKVL
jgi:hypothetical protein